MEKVIKFSDIGSQRQTFNQHAGPILIKTMDINKILVSNKVSFGKKNINILNIIKKEDSEPEYNEKYLKAKMKSYNGKINTYFHNNKIPKHSHKK